MCKMQCYKLACKLEDNNKTKQFSIWLEAFLGTRKIKQWGQLRLLIISPYLSIPSPQKCIRNVPSDPFFFNDHSAKLFHNSLSFRVKMFYMIALLYYFTLCSLHNGQGFHLNCLGCNLVEWNVSLLWNLPTFYFIKIKHCKVESFQLDGSTPSDYCLSDERGNLAQVFFFWSKLCNGSTHEAKLFFCKCHAVNIVHWNQLFAASE